jgi:hypothetical protein
LNQFLAPPVKASFAKKSCAGPEVVPIRRRLEGRGPGSPGGHLEANLPGTIIVAR